MNHRANQFSRRRYAFTLLELIVVMGIILILAGLLVPMLLRANRQADQTRLKAQLSLIATGIESYRADFGDIPRFDSDIPGACLLGLKLAGPLDAIYVSVNPNPALTPSTSTSFPIGSLAVQGTAAPIFVSTFDLTGPPPGTGWVELATFNGGDGVDGPGFKLASRANISSPGGPVRGPYVNVDRFTLRGGVILDAAGNPILYYPRRSNQTNVRSPNAYITFQAPLTAVISQYNAGDNGNGNQGVSAGAPTPLNFGLLGRDRFAWIMGDVNNSGNIDGDESPRGTQPFILMSAGPDRNLGFIAGEDWPTAAAARRAYAARLDDATNLELP